MSLAADVRIQEALASVRRLNAVIDQMSEAEVLKAIALEEAAGRRPSLLARLYRRARADAASPENLARKIEALKFPSPVKE